jgi:hypothetical protein
MATRLAGQNVEEGGSSGIVITLWYYMSFLAKIDPLLTVESSQIE